MGLHTYNTFDRHYHVQGVRYRVVLCWISLDFILLSCSQSYCRAWRCMALHCFILYCIALYCIALYCIVLYWIVMRIRWRIFSRYDKMYYIMKNCFRLFDVIWRYDFLMLLYGRRNVIVCDLVSRYYFWYCTIFDRCYVLFISSFWWWIQDFDSDHDASVDWLTLLPHIVMRTPHLRH